MLFTDEQLGKMNAKHAVVSLSGGMDSSTLLLKCIKEFDTVTALSFDYGQKHRVELERAQSLVDYLKASGYNVRYQVIKLDGLSQLLNSALVSGGDEVPEGHYAEENMKATVVPNRNKIFSSIIQAVALSVADTTEEDTAIAMGIHAGDFSVYPDCRQEFRDIDFEAFKEGNWGAERVHVYTPYLHVMKGDILKDGEFLCDYLEIEFDEVYSRTNTSYKPMQHDGVWYSDYKSAASVERIEGFIHLGRPDPVAYGDEEGPASWEKAKAHVEQVLAAHGK
jgi:7-cyano-7-deazaguanine synthase